MRPSNFHHLSFARANCSVCSAFFVSSNVVAGVSAELFFPFSARLFYLAVLGRALSPSHPNSPQHGRDDMRGGAANHADAQRYATDDVDSATDTSPHSRADVYHQAPFSARRCRRWRGKTRTYAAATAGIVLPGQGSLPSASAWRVRHAACCEANIEELHGWQAVVLPPTSGNGAPGESSRCVLCRTCYRIEGRVVFCGNVVLESDRSLCSSTVAAGRIHSPCCTALDVRVRHLGS